MPCYHPMTAYRSRLGRNSSGAWPLAFSPNDGYEDLKVQIPCGKCIGCRLEYARQWAIRCVDELKDHKYSCYLTLTYDDENVPEDMNLRPRDFCLFMKRLRNFADPMRIRFFQCGEYGDKTNRPHHHAIIFGFDFPDRELLKEERGIQYDSSAIANGLWQKGFVTIGNVEYRSCAYVARYIMKKQKVDIDSDFVQPYITMSRNPGIGANHFEKYHEEIFNTDSCIIDGREQKPPKWYDDKYREINPRAMARIKKERQKNAIKRAVKDNRPLSEHERYALEIQKQKGARNES